MKMSEINKVFTEKVAEYIAKGYAIHPVSMSGSQGEIGKVDLVKGEELIRVWMDDKSGWRNSDGYTKGYRYIAIGRWNYPASDAARHTTVWYHDIEVLEELKYYEIGRDTWYVDSLEEALRTQELTNSRKNNSRYHVPTHTYITDPRRIEIARKFLKRKHGYKRVSVQNIELRQSPYGDYVITYNGHDYFMH